MNFLKMIKFKPKGVLFAAIAICMVHFSLGAPNSTDSKQNPNEVSKADSNPNIRPNRGKSHSSEALENNLNSSMRGNDSNKNASMERSVILEREAKNHYSSGEIAKGRIAAIKANLGDVDTVRGRLELADRLIQIALELRRSYEFERSNQVALEALEILDVSDINQADIDTIGRSKIHSLAGFIHEELFHDHSSALQEYSKAELMHSDSPSAKRGIGRLRSKDAKSKRLSDQAEKGVLREGGGG